MEVVGSNMKVVTIYAILDVKNNIVSTTHKENQAIETVEILSKTNKSEYKIVPCNGLIIV